MGTTSFHFRSGNQLSEKSILLWRITQSVIWMAGAVIVYCLLFFPSAGLLMFWDILIPVAPLLFVVSVGVWRNVCPLAATNLLPRHWGLSKRKKLSATTIAWLNLAGVIALYAIVPLRHAVFNRSGMATAVLILCMVFTGVMLGFFYEWKSAWCSGLCPVHSVEKLYGSNPWFSMPNAHCDQCRNCVIPCPDSTPNITPASAKKTIVQQLSGLLIIGGLPGFIWGWFHTPDNNNVIVNNWAGTYEMPLLGFAVTFIAFNLLSIAMNPQQEKKLISVFAAAGVSCYYWYRIPALLGFGKFADDGLLINLTGILPAWTILLITAITTVFFFYWLVLRKPNQQSWVIRPPFAGK